MVVLVVVVFKQSGIGDEMVLSLLLSLVVATPLDMNYRTVDCPIKDS